jgi:hypothetical protein
MLSSIPANTWTYGTRELTAFTTEQVGTLVTENIQAMNDEGFLKAIVPAQNSVDVNVDGEVAAVVGEIDLGELEDDIKYLKYRVRFPNKKGIHG